MPKPYIVILPATPLLLSCIILSSISYTPDTQYIPLVLSFSSLRSGSPYYARALDLTNLVTSAYAQDAISEIYTRCKMLHGTRERPRLAKMLTLSSKRIRISAWQCRTVRNACARDWQITIAMRQYQRDAGGWTRNKDSIRVANSSDFPGVSRFLSKTLGVFFACTNQICS